MDIAVRTVSPQDWRLLRGIRLRALADAPEAFGSTLDREEAFGESDWQARLDPRHGPRLIATEADSPVGMVGSFNDPADGSVVHLVGMWVDPAYRGSGVAPLLLDTFVEHARLDGRLAVQLTVVESNEPARRLYRSHGFVETGETEPHPKGGAVEIVMVHRLDGP